MLRPLRDEWQMAFAADGPAALELLAREPYDVIVSDMRMPGMDGAALLAIVCERHPAVVRIIMSGYSELEASVRAVPVAHQFLAKPCESAVLRRSLDQQSRMVDRFASRTVAELVGSLRAVPAAPRSYHSLCDALTAAHASIDRVADIVANDVGLSARTLQLASSAFFGRSRTVSDIRTAVKNLGSDIFGQLVGTADIFRGFEPSTPVTGFAIERFQQHGHLTGAIAERLALPAHDAGLWLVAGVVHDVGKLVLADREPDRFGQAQATAQAQQRPAHVVEAEVFGLSHAEIGAYLLSLWGLPNAIVEAVANHHHPARASDDAREIASAIHLANILAHRHDDGATVTGGAAALPTIDPDVLSPLGGEGKLAAWCAMAGEVAATPLATR
jgi:putative nucleotidyltransferase with HDIG domain